MTATTAYADRRTAAEDRLARRRRILAVALVPLLLATSAAPIVAMVVH